MQLFSLLLWISLFSPEAPVISAAGKTGNDNEKPCRFSNASSNIYPQSLIA